MDYITPFIKWLLNSDYIKNNKLFLNAIEAKDNNIQIVTQQIPENQIQTYINGSKAYPIIFYVNNYKSVSYNQLVKSMIEGNENVTDLLDVQEIISFVQDMNKKNIFPNFGERFSVERVRCQNVTPSTPAIDGSVSPALAKFTIPVVCEVFEDAEEE